MAVCLQASKDLTGIVSDFQTQIVLHCTPCGAPVAVQLAGGQARGGTQRHNVRLQHGGEDACSAAEVARALAVNNNNTMPILCQLKLSKAHLNIHTGRRVVLDYDLLKDRRGGDCMSSAASHTV
ncbi:MAG: hypothetical protein FRX49_01516 [Trebouxia sp. A1-2]|nr:MAG: hypothetical protein FRX49_01516 [Trebouxia sp. A1-2]